MPCESGPSLGDHYKEEINHLTQMLCFSCQIIEHQCNGGMPCSDLAVWWKQHQLDDEERLREQQARVDRAATRRFALAKLTDEERRELGL